MAPSLILPGLWQGSRDDMEDDAFMATITHVLSATNVPCRRPHVECLHLGVKDKEEAPISRHFARASAFVHAARAGGGVTYVHCSQGVSRSSALVAAYLMVATGAPATEALRFLILRRPAACPNLGFYNQLRSFDAAAGDLVKMRSSEDAKALADALLTPAAAAVSVGAFDEALRASGGGGAWHDRVVARAALDFGDRRLPKGSVVRVLETGPIEGAWRGVLDDGAVGTFARRGVRELDCASSEDEDYYQGSMGILDHLNEERAVRVGLQAWLLRPEVPPPPMCARQSTGDYADDVFESDDDQ